MSFECTFKQMNHREDLVEFCQARVEKLEKVFNHPLHVKMTLSVERKGCCAELKLDGAHMHIKAHGDAFDFNEAIEIAFDRAMKQILKKKAKMADLRRKKSKHEHKLVSLTEHRDKSIDGFPFKKTGNE